MRISPHLRLICVNGIILSFIDNLLTGRYLQVDTFTHTEKERERERERERVAQGFYE